MCPAGIRATDALFTFHRKLESASLDAVSLDHVPVEYMRSQRQLLIDNNIQFVQIGRREGLPEGVLEELRNTLGRDAGQYGHGALPGD